MVLCKGDAKSTKNINFLFKRYVESSSQFFNPSKSLIYAGAMSHDRHLFLAYLYGFNIAHPPFIYLSVQIFRGRYKAKHLRHIADKVASWKTSLLSMAGRLKLIMPVAYSMLKYSIQIYDWSVKHIKNLERWFKHLLWNGDVDKRKFITSSWHMCCKSIK